MTLRALSMVFFFLTSAAQAQNSMTCRGSVFIAEFNAQTDISIVFDSNSGAIEVYDISNDLEEWVPFKAERASIGSFRSLITASATGDYPPQIDVGEYKVTYEVDDVLGFPETLFGFTGKIGGIRVPPVDLTCTSLP